MFGESDGETPGKQKYGPEDDYHEEEFGWGPAGEKRRRSQGAPEETHADPDSRRPDER